MKLSEYERQTPKGVIRMVKLQCDHKPTRVFNCTLAGMERLESKFDGKHYHNQSIYELQRSGGLPEANR